MGLVDFVFSSIGTCTEIVCFLLDLNFIIVHSLIRCVLACFNFINNLPSLLIDSAVECWNLAVFSLVSLAESATVGTQGAVSMLGGVLESLKMVGHLSSHVWLRGREQLHRGALSVCEGCGIAVSLAVYLVNSAVNMVLIAAQNMYWAVSGPLQVVLELTLTLLTFLYSSLVGTSLFLWIPCSLALECLFLLAQLLLSVFVLNVYGLVFTASALLAAALYLNPELIRRGALYVDSVPALRRLRASLRRLRGSASRIPGALRRLRTELRRLYLQERGRWRRLLSGLGAAGLGQGLGSRLRLRLGLGDDRVAGDGEPGQGGAAAADGADRRAPPDGRAGVGRPQERPGPPRHHQRRPPEDRPELAAPSSSADRPLQKLYGAREDGKAGQGSADGLLSLLKEQEDRKRCVICQDSTKTVVLLPCRHLCLCRDCTAMLLRQPIYLQNCPLCRHMILTTMDVYL